MADEEHKAGPGFGGSETSSAEVILYTHGDDPIFLQAGTSGAVEFRGRGADASEPSLVNCNTTKVLGAAAGTFNITIKVPVGSAFNPREFITDDDWVDIVFRRHNAPYHVMRGSVDFVQRDRSVAGSGATSTSWTIIGRDFGKIWESTPIWFNAYTAENLGGGAALQAFAQAEALYGNVKQTIDAYLFAFLRQLGTFGRQIWELPPGMPGVPNGSRFESVVKLNSQNYRDDPERIAINPNMLNPDNQTLWALAQEWSDPTFCELFTDLVKPGSSDTVDADGVGPEADVGDLSMAVILRDRPFPTHSWASGDVNDSQWYSLPQYRVARQSVVSDPVGRGGYERYNTFFLSPQILAELGAAQLILTAPLYDQADVLRHGVRRMDITSKYLVKDLGVVGLVDNMRRRARDWHCLNPYLLSGSIQLAHGRPDIRIGGRLLIPGATQGDDEDFYIEGVTNNWDLTGGLKTQLQVTRGWMGGDASYKQALLDTRDRYKLADAASYSSTGVNLEIGNQA